MSIECFEKTRRGVPLLPLQTVVDYELLYCGRQAPHLSGASPPLSAQQLWPIGHDLAASGTDHDERGSAEPSIFNDELATTRHAARTDDTTSGRPQSMFDLPCDIGRGYSTATMSTGDATRDERTAGHNHMMSDEARAAMLDCVSLTPYDESPPSTPSPVGVPLAKVVTELQAARQLTSKTLATIQPDDVDTSTSTSEGKGDARLPQAGASLYPALNNGPSRSTLLDYYSAKAAERTGQSPAPASRRQQSSVPRVTMGFFPSSQAAGRNDDNDFLASTPTPPTPGPVHSGRPTTVDERPATQGHARTLAERTDSQPAIVHAPVSTDRSVSPQAQHGGPPATAVSAKQQKTQPAAKRNQSEAGGLRTPAPESAGGYRRQTATAAASKLSEKTTTTIKTESTTAATAASSVPAINTSSKTAPGTDHQQHVTTPSVSTRHRPADRQVSEPVRVTASSPHREMTSTRTSSPTRHSNITGAATDVFLSSILSHLVPVPPVEERDWGHFTLVKPTTTSTRAAPAASQDSKPTKSKR